MGANEFLPAVDLEKVNVTDKVDTVTVENADRSTEVKKQINKQDSRATTLTRQVIS